MSQILRRKHQDQDQAVTASGL
ncbi:hypothetical protein HID58_027369 [Brassica napus]|uniref:Uncharacterized protein n=1 Tax=Brassica napus TaxID=3708 RepID=A0ABQ8CRL4_BRANA|nr:hypothetical protein HID58_027369 [Brassica napus]